MIPFRLASIATLALFMSLPAQAADVNATASYVVTLGGINIAAMTVDLKDDGSRFSLDLSAKVAGLGAVVSSGTATASATGRSSSRSLQAEEFDLQTKANGETFTVDVSFAGGGVSAFKVDPPILDNYDRVPLERSHLTGVSDFLSAFVLKGGGLDKSLCEREAHIFTGVERFNITMSYAGDDEATSPRTGYQGPVVLCTVDYNPVSGHFTSSDITNYMADSDRIIIWYAPLAETGFYIPYRVLLGTNMGDLSMVLTSLKN
ncbi:DUF3108 domain-containing protein [Devosia psychrophila]|uniref:DUF3108 domain-containing protein n=1 Tax=Devosia psychrophila TaxID=728005 RepID=A0A0F5PU37_9HYPH|nr:DUF3108 domain-containing protein [Devosia psychrophila]KKC32105.1 hypothetical protein WH91_15860 [Devosia psychrophila]SFD19954.1 Protein of unknown function [Devosia psychrophila]